MSLISIHRLIGSSGFVEERVTAYQVTPACSPRATSAASSSRSWTDWLMRFWAWILILSCALGTLLCGLSLVGLGSLSSVVLPCLVLIPLVVTSFCLVTILLLCSANGPTAPPPS